MDCECGDMMVGGQLIMQSMSVYDGSTLRMGVTAPRTIIQSLRAVLRGKNGGAVPSSHGPTQILEVWV